MYTNILYIIVRPLKTNNEIYESLNNEYRQYFHMKTIQSQKSLNNSEIQSIQMDDSKQTESTNPITTSSNASKVRIFSS